jgi:hypothetical protein
MNGMKGNKKTPCSPRKLHFRACKALMKIMKIAVWDLQSRTYESADLQSAIAGGFR